MLTYYATQFPLVELNFTFYRQPLPQDLERLAAKAPPGFQFLVKLHQAISHEHDLSAADAFRDAVHPLTERGSLLGLLCQYPQRFHYTSDNVQELGALAERFAGYTLAVEFRHVSWHRPDVLDWLAERGLHIVSVDVPPLPALFPSGLLQSSRLIYVRLHSRRAAAWHLSDKERYDYAYSDDELREWVASLSQARDRADRAFVLFNNCHRSNAPINARRMRELLGQLAPGLSIVPPPAAGQRQGMLW
jgi:uncharacterized protein YecE (DUF72 family)